MRKNVGSPVAVILLFAVSAAVGFDGNGEKAAKKPEKAAKETAKHPVTPEMETEAMNFVQNNHPELVELLHQLKTTNPTQYQQAMRDLSRSASTLATTQKNDHTKYILDLKAWRMNSQIQVIAARLAMSPTPELKEELRARLLDQVDLRVEQQRLERERTEARLKKLDESISKLQQSRDQEASKAFDKLTRTTLKPGPKKENKPVVSGAKSESPDKPTATPK